MQEDPGTVGIEMLYRGMLPGDKLLFKDFPRMHNGYLIDMDGVIYKGSKLIPGAIELVEGLNRLNAPFLFLTNNSERTPKDLVSKLGHLGLKVSWKNFYTAAHCTADFLSRQRPVCSAFVIGEGGLLIA